MRYTSGAARGSGQAAIGPRGNTPAVDRRPATMPAPVRGDAISPMTMDTPTGRLPAGEERMSPAAGSAAATRTGAWLGAHRRRADRHGRGLVRVRRPHPAALAHRLDADRHHRTGPGPVLARLHRLQAEPVDVAAGAQPGLRAGAGLVHLLRRRHSAARLLLQGAAPRRGAVAVLGPVALRLRRAAGRAGLGPARPGDAGPARTARRRDAVRDAADPAEPHGRALRPVRALPDPGRAVALPHARRSGRGGRSPGRASSCSPR